MISMSLSEKFCCRNLITTIKVSDMTRGSNKTNKLRNINTIGCRTSVFFLVCVCVCMCVICYVYTGISNKLSIPWEIMNNYNVVIVKFSTRVNWLNFLC